MKNYKKLFAVITISCLLFSSNVVFAETTSGGPETKERAVQREQVQEKAQAVRTWMKELQPMFQEVRKNNKEIIQLRNTLGQTKKEALQVINKFREQKDTLTEDQIAELKEYLQLMKGDKTEIKEELGTVQKEVLKLRTAKKDGQIDQAKEILQNILEIQQDRIDLLTKAIEDLKTIDDIN
jgi:uncharacterized phage infection (PIP) family protein YhgE